MTLVHPRAETYFTWRTATEDEVNARGKQVVNPSKLKSRLTHHTERLPPLQKLKPRIASCPGNLSPFKEWVRRLAHYCTLQDYPVLF